MSTETIQIPDNIPVSWLPNHPQLDPEMLLLVSVPSTKTETGFMSKYITFRDLKAGLQEMFQIDNTHTVIEQISGEYFPILDSLSSNSICCDVGNPYIISAIVQKDGNICQLSGYRLSSAMEHLHQEVAFDTLKAKKIEIAGWPGSNPLKSMYGYQIVDWKIDTNIKAGHHTFNYCMPPGGTTRTIAVSLEDISDEAKAAFLSTQLEFKLYVDNTRAGAVASHNIDWSGLSGEVLSRSDSTSDVRVVGVGQRCLFTIQGLSPTGPFFVDKAVLLPLSEEAEIYEADSM